MKKRSQGAVEFLMTYGWAILMAVIVIGALGFYFGDDNKASYVVDHCLIMPGIYCGEFLVNEDTVSLRLKNSLGKDLDNLKFTFKNLVEGQCESASFSLEDGQEETIVMAGSHCGDLIPNAEEIVEWGEETLDLEYSVANTEITHNTDVSIFGVVQEGRGAEFTDGCMDSDGYDEYTYGIISGYHMNGRPYTYFEYCVTGTSVREYYCKPGDHYSFGYDSVHCPPDAPVCEDGKCVEGECTSNCHYCGDGNCDPGEYSRICHEDCEGPYCGDGECISPENYYNCFEECGALTCTETDDGIDYEVKGTVTDIYGRVNTDSCASNTRLMEYWCMEGYGSSGWRYYDCGIGGSCVDGACIIDTSDFCYDTDYGVYSSRPGEVKGYFNEEYYETRDYCVDETHLKEYYCEGDIAEEEDIECTAGCMHGMCNYDRGEIWGMEMW
jgi:hypothetical protein